MTNATHARADGWGQTSEEILTKNFPLHKACRDGDVETLSILLVEAQHGIYVEDSFYGWTPAHWSSYFGKLACLRKLMTVTRIGADCNLKTSRFKQSPAHLAAFGDHPHCLNWLLLSGANINAQDYLGETPAHKGARNGSIECLSLLANHGARLYIRNNNNLTPAQLSAECGYVDCSKYLESVASRQEQSEFKGVYENQNVVSSLSSHSMSSPSCHDVTLNTASPCSSNFGISAAPQVPSPISEEISESPMHSMNELNQVEFEMDEESDSHVENFSFPLCNKQNLFNCDITINKDVSFNKLSVAGKKRCREDTEESDYKRIRRDVVKKSWDVWGTYPEFHSECLATESDDQLLDASILDHEKEHMHDFNMASHNHFQDTNNSILQNKPMTPVFTSDESHEMQPNFNTNKQYYSENQNRLQGHLI